MLKTFTNFEDLKFLQIVLLTRYHSEKQIFCYRNLFSFQDMRWSAQFVLALFQRIKGFTLKTLVMFVRSNIS